LICGTQKEEKRQNIHAPIFNTVNVKKDMGLTPKVTKKKHNKSNSSVITHPHESLEEQK